MCGIVGCAGIINGTHEKALKVLLVLDSLRGEDSTGAAFVQRNTGNVTVAKQLGDPFNLFNDNKFTQNLSKVNRAIIGHNRYATVGGVSRSTAHPFDFDSLVGVHNGTLASKWKLEDHLDYKVDSQALYHGFEKNGVRDTIDRLGADGNAWSLVWWNKGEESLNFLRNKHRPMFMCRTKDTNVLFWASEPWMLSAALGRFNIEHGPVFETEEDTHYSVYIDNRGMMDKPKLARMAAPVYIPPPVTYHNVKPQNLNNVGKPVENNVVRLPSAHPATAVTPATSKGVVEEKKQSGVSGSNCDPSYVGRKQLLLEILASSVDSNGAKYLSLFDPKYPYVDIRVYPRKNDEDLFEQVGMDITGDINGWSQADKKAIRGYYKVDPDSVMLIPESVPTFEQQVKELLADDDVDTDLFPNHRGHFVSVKEWKLMYPTCAWCSDAPQPENGNRFTTGGECVCPSCVRNPEVRDYVNLI